MSEEHIDLLKIAAEYSNHEISWTDCGLAYYDVYDADGFYKKEWNPIESDGDAFDLLAGLASRFKIEISLKGGDLREHRLSLVKHAVEVINGSVKPTCEIKKWEQRILGKKYKIVIYKTS